MLATRISLLSTSTCFIVLGGISSTLATSSQLEESDSFVAKFYLRSNKSSMDAALYLDIALLKIGTAIVIVTSAYARSTRRSGIMMLTLAFSMTTFLSASAA